MYLEQVGIARIVSVVIVYTRIVDWKGSKVAFIHIPFHKYDRPNRNMKKMTH